MGKAERRLGYAQALLEELAAVTGESINFDIRAVHVVLDVMSRPPPRCEQELGSRMPVHPSDMGTCLLANSGDLDEEVKRVVVAIAIQGPTVRLTDDWLPKLVALLEPTTQRLAIGL